MPSRIPPRISWAIDQLAVEPDDRVLEVGCGRGIAVELVSQRLGAGHVTGIDRSLTAVAAARSRNRQSVRAGKARLLAVALSDLDVGAAFDKIFAINVNVFWLNPARELRVIRELLGPGGRVYLFYQPPSSGLVGRITRRCTAHLQEAGFAVLDVRRAKLASVVGVCLIASLSSD